jgi:hypothetical protein
MLEYYESEVARHNPGFDWNKRVAFVGSGPGNPFPIWYGADRFFDIAAQRGMVGLHIPADDPNLGKTVRRFDPDVVIVCHSNQSRFRVILPEIRKSTSAPVGLWYGDLRPVMEYVPGGVDRLFMCWNKSYKEYDLEKWSDKFKAPHSFMMNSAAPNPKIHSFNPNKDIPIVFIGTAYLTKLWSYRREFLSKIPVQVYAGGQRKERVAISDQAGKLYRSYHFCLATSPSVPGLQSDRLFVIMACGGLALVDWFDGVDRVFTPGKHILTFNTHDSDDAKRVVKRYMGQPELCEQIRMNGWKLQQSRHTTGHRILNMVDNLLTGSDKFWGWLE